MSHDKKCTFFASRSTIIWSGRQSADTEPSLCTQKEKTKWKHKKHCSFKILEMKTSYYFEQTKMYYWIKNNINTEREREIERQRHTKNGWIPLGRRLDLNLHCLWRCCLYRCPNHVWLNLGYFAVRTPIVSNHSILGHRIERFSFVVRCNVDYQCCMHLDHLD